MTSPLFSEDFEAWIHGPVLPVLYDKYKYLGRKPIDENVESKLPENIKEFLEQLSNEYFACDTYELEQMTHIEDPWRLARKNLSSDTPSNVIISKESMKKYFRANVGQN